MDKHYTTEDVINGYNVIKELGEGKYGIAYLGVNSLGERVVIKQLKNKMLRQSKKKSIYEAKVLKSLDNIRFPKFIGRFIYKGTKGYILEYIEGKTFAELLYKDHYELKREEIYEIGSKLIEFVEILYENNIVHKDIRCANVIQKENKELVLIDFGLARFVDNKKYTKDMDFWYISDFLIHLYYSSYQYSLDEERPWFEELDLSKKEKFFLKSLMGIESKYKSIEKIKEDFEEIKKEYYSVIKIIK